MSSGAARADIWGYVDESGRSHLAAEKIDDRYTLFFKGGTRVDKPAAAPAAIEAAEPAPAAAASSARTLATLHPAAARFEPLIKQYAKMHNVDPALVKAVIAVESAFQPGVVSPKGAMGLMQVIPDTGERYGVVGDKKASTAQKLSDPATNLRVGTRYLRDLLGMFAQNIELALAAYNAGEGAVARYNNKVPPYPETREYVKKVQKLYADLKPRPAAPVATANAAASAVKQVRFVVPGQRTATSGLIPISATMPLIDPSPASVTPPLTTTVEPPA